MRVFHKSSNVAVTGPRAIERAFPDCRSGSPDPDPFVIRRSQTTDVAVTGLRAIERALPACRSGSPDPDPFVIRRSQTTEGKHIVTLDNAGETLSDARMASEGPRATIKKTVLELSRVTAPASVGVRGHER